MDENELFISDISISGSMKSSINSNLTVNEYHKSGILSNPSLHADPVDIVVDEISLELTNEIHKKSTISRLITKESNGSGRSIRILQNVSLKSSSGQLTAIMGPSGCGKTTLLNIMAGKLLSGDSSALKLSGNVIYNGQHLSSANCKKIAHVQQHDILLPHLTVRETLRIAADLRLPLDMPRIEKYRLVEEVILELGLKECGNTLIGDRFNHGCSGGEKRRVSIGIQMLTNPSVIYLDEPTTGLDSTTAFHLVKTLRSLARQGRTVVISIHQPRSDIFALFDNVVLLSGGRLAYAGPRIEMASYFSNLGIVCPKDVNPADFFLDMVSIDKRTLHSEEVTEKQAEYLISSWDSRIPNIEEFRLHHYDELPSGLCVLHGECKGILYGMKRYLHETGVLMYKSIQNYRRNGSKTYGLLIESILLALIIGSIFHQLDGSLYGIKSRSGATLMVLMAQNYIMTIMNTNHLCQELKVFDRDRQDNMHGVLSYITAMFSTSALFQLPIHCFYAVITYFMIGFRQDDWIYFYMYIAGHLILYLAMISFTWVCASFSRDFAVASLLVNTIFGFIALASGFFISTKYIRYIVRWMENISSVYYSFRLFSSIEFSDRLFDCPFKKDIIGDKGPCREYNGNVILSNFGFEPNDFIMPFVALALISVVQMVLAYALLRFWQPTKTKLSKSYHNEKRRRVYLEINNVNDLQEDEDFIAEQKKEWEYALVLSQLSLKMQKRIFKYPEVIGNEIKCILKGVDAKFENGKLSVILGVSGAGKSSLLNVLAGRITNSSFFSSSRYHIGGNLAMLDNDGVSYPISPMVLKSFIAYVTQDDDRLLPALTVRETLLYAARFRLSKLIDSERQDRVEKIICALGLTDCADTPIGDHIIKGVSGGQKRRVSIAVQLLSFPRILLLDEPTSGLDAFTAHSIMQLLKNLASGKVTGTKCSVICTIHQPRYDIWKFVDSVMVLAKGGTTIYSGEREGMTEWLDKMGLKCPDNVNPADFVLDYTAINSRNSEDEEKSQSNLARLAKYYEDETQPLLGQDQMDQGQLAVVSYHEISREPPFATIKSFLYKSWLGIRRSYLNIMRQPPLLASRLMQTMGFGIVLTGFMRPLGHDYESIQTRFGVLHQVAGVAFTGVLNCLSVYPQEKRNFLGEFEDGAVSIESFLLSYMANEILFEIISAFGFSIIVFVLGQYQMSWMNFGVDMFCVFVLTNIGESVGIVFTSLVNEDSIAITYVNLVLTIFEIMSGLLSVNMPKFMDNLNVISPFKYFAELQVNQEFPDDLQFTCTDEQKFLVAPGIYKCPLENGKEVRALYRFNDINLGQTVMVLMLIVFAARFIAYLSLKLKLFQRR